MGWGKPRAFIPQSPVWERETGRPSLCACRGLRVQWLRDTYGHVPHRERGNVLCGATIAVAAAHLRGCGAPGRVEGILLCAHPQRSCRRSSSLHLVTLAVLMHLAPPLLGALAHNPGPTSSAPTPLRERLNRDLHLTTWYSAHPGTTTRDNPVIAAT